MIARHSRRGRKPDSRRALDVPSMTSNQLSRTLLGAPFWGLRFTNFVEIDVSGLNVVEGRAGVFVIPSGRST